MFKVGQLVKPSTNEFGIIDVDIILQVTEFNNDEPDFFAGVVVKCDNSKFNKVGDSYDSYMSYYWEPV